MMKFFWATTTLHLPLEPKKVSHNCESKYQFRKVSAPLCLVSFWVHGKKQAGEIRIKKLKSHQFVVREEVRGNVNKTSVSVAWVTWRILRSVQVSAMTGYFKFCQKIRSHFGLFNQQESDSNS